MCVSVSLAHDAVLGNPTNSAVAVIILLRVKTWRRDTRRSEIMAWLRAVSQCQAIRTLFLAEVSSLRLSLGATQEKCRLVGVVGMRIGACWSLWRW